MVGLTHGAEPWAGTLAAATGELRKAAPALPEADHDRFAAALLARLRTPTRWQDPPPPTTVTQRVRQGVRAVELLAAAGVTDQDLLLVALQLPWCDPALGGDRGLATERPRVTGWPDAVLFATLAAEPRPGEDPMAARLAHLRHVSAMPAEIRAIVVASWRAGPGERAAQHRELVAAVTPLLAGLPAEFRDAVLRPPTLLARFTGATPTPVDPRGPEPITHPDVAVAAARAAEPMAAAGPLTVEEYDVGYLLWLAPGAGSAAEPGSRVPALIVDRQTRAVTSWYELSPGHAMEIYAARHRLFPLAPGWRLGDRPPVEQGLGAGLPAPLVAVIGQLAEQYRGELSGGTGWPATVDRWSVGTGGVALLGAADLAEPVVLAAALLAPLVAGQDEPTVRWYRESLPPIGARLLDAARIPPVPPGQRAGDVFDAYVAGRIGAAREVRAVAAAFALAGARHALVRFGGVCPVRRAELGRLRALTTDLPVLDAELAAWAAPEHAAPEQDRSAT